MLTEEYEEAVKAHKHLVENHLFWANIANTVLKGAQTRLCAAPYSLIKISALTKKRVRRSLEKLWPAELS